MRTDEAMMRRAIELAARGAGWTNPNPLVGAVVVKDGRVIGEGYHERYGEQHAERNALDACTEDPAGATLYVTLEPCCHQGKQPPCTDAVIAAGIKRVVVGSRDPNPLVSGRGNELLRQAGIQVEEDVLREECDELNPVFFHFIQTGRPYVVCKWAMTLDGKIATRTGDARWVSNEPSRADTHWLRHRLAAIMVGRGTVEADDPMLTVRRDVLSNQPLRVVADSRLSISEDAQLVRTAREVSVLVACGDVQDAARAAKVDRLRELGVDVVSLPGAQGSQGAGQGSAQNGAHGKVDLATLMDHLGRAGVDSVLVEGGGQLHEALFAAGLVDEVVVYVAPKVCGGADAKTPVAGRGAELMADAFQLAARDVRRFGDDVRLVYVREGAGKTGVATCSPA